jgi:pimeloyl-ACP methyl ester carboxylesterase
VDVAFDSRQLRASAEDAALMSSAAAVLRHGYPGLHVPTTIMTGGADRIVEADEQSRRLHEEVAGSRLLVLPGVGHMIHYPAQAKVGREVDALMARPPVRPRGSAG